MALLGESIALNGKNFLTDRTPERMNSRNRPADL